MKERRKGGGSGAPPQGKAPFTAAAPCARKRGWRGSRKSELDHAGAAVGKERAVACRVAPWGRACERAIGSERRGGGAAADGGAADCCRV